MSRKYTGCEFRRTHWTRFVRSPLTVNEPQPLLLCLNNLHGLRCSSKSPIGGWQRFYDCP
jgi:hypothetical protein